MASQKERVDAKNTQELKATGDGMSGEYIYGAQVLLLANDDVATAHGADYDGVNGHLSSSGQYTLTKGSGLNKGTITFSESRAGDQEQIKACITRISKKAVAFS